MKKYIYMIAAAALTFAGCAKEVVKVDDAPKSDGKMMTFTAVVEEPIMDAETKATLSRGGVFAWDGGEEVCFFKDNGESVMGTVSADGSTIEVTAGEYVCAVYPGAAASLKNKVSFDAPGPVIVAKVNGSNLEFHHIGSLVNIKIANAPSTSTLEFTSSATAGDGTFSFDSDGKPVLAAGTTPVSISVENVKAAQLAAGLTISVPNVSYAAGFAVGLKDGARYVYKKEASANEKYSGLAARGKLLNMKALDYVPSSKFYVSTTSPYSYWTRQDVRMIQSEASKYETWMNLDGESDIYIYDEYNIGNAAYGYLYKGKVSDDRYYQLTWDGANGDVIYKSTTRDNPFWDADYPVSEMAISGDFNSWGATNFTYNGNMNWSLSDLVIASSDSYKFKIRKSSDWSYQAGINTGLESSSSLYGTLKSDAGDTSVFLNAGTYDVYMCATDKDEEGKWYYLIMFEKQ